MPAQRCKPSDNRGWVETLDRAPFDETFHDLEDFEEWLTADRELESIFWVA